MCVYVHVNVKGRIAELFVLFLRVDSRGDTRITLSGRCLYSLNHVIGSTNDAACELFPLSAQLSRGDSKLFELCFTSQCSRRWVGFLKEEMEPGPGAPELSCLHICSGSSEMYVR